MWVPKASIQLAPGARFPEERPARVGCYWLVRGTETRPNGDQPLSNQVIEVIYLAKAPFGSGNRMGHLRQHTDARDELWLSSSGLS